jgi:predicted small secreted protein
MKYKITVLLACISMMLVGCGTIGGTVAGAGEDLTKAGEWIKNR